MSLYDTMKIYNYNMTNKNALELLNRLVIINININLIKLQKLMSRKRENRKYTLNMIFVFFYLNNNCI